MAPFTTKTSKSHIVNGLVHSVCKSALRFKKRTLKRTRRIISKFFYQCVAMRYQFFNKIDESKFYHLLETISSQQCVCLERKVNEDISPFFIEKIRKKTARYWAAFLWNWKIVNYFQDKNAKIQFILWCLNKTVEAMDEKELEVLKAIFQSQYYSKILNALENSQTVKDHLQLCIFNNKKFVKILKPIIHKWFLVMPILKELEKLIKWEHLKRDAIFILGLDAMYSFFLETVQKFKDSPVDNK